MKKTIVAMVLVLGGAVAAGTIKVWSSGQALTAADLNANFSHIHGLMVGGHGARLVDADVSGSADIAQSKVHGLTTAVASVPRAWGMLFNICTPAVCADTLSASSGVTSVSHTAAGKWTVTLTTARATGADGGANYAMLVTPYQAIIQSCGALNITSTTFDIWCQNTLTQTIGDTRWSFAIFDE